MNRRVIQYCIILCFIFIVYPYAARAAGISVGAASWFCWWEPYWIKFPSYSVLPVFVPLKHDARINPAPIYGPILIFHLPKHFSISSIFLYGRFNLKRNETVLYTAGLTPSVFPYRENSVIQRFDSDSSISYSIIKYFNLYIGFKYSHYEFSSNTRFYVSTGGLLGNKKTKYDEYAPAFGLGVLVPLVAKQLYLIFHSSVVYNFTEVKLSGTSYLINTFGPGVPILPILHSTPRENLFYRIGSNSTISLAWWIDQINTTLSIGFRYQMFKLLKSDPSLTYVRNQLHYYEHIYGATASAIYRFDFAQKKGEKEIESEVEENQKT
ncbi:MAG: hypothetical protein A2W19_15610 [Spirochaetes bacterium RBG_16_49_21]|nr:MAG: hypothetical protein A2W19_15610 [Spirochaetes bacterium RBG_16_49_21]